MRPEQSCALDSLALSRLCKCNGKIAIDTWLVDCVQFFRRAAHVAISQPQHVAEFWGKTFALFHDFVAGHDDFLCEAFEGGFIDDGVFQQSVSGAHGAHVTLKRWQIGWLCLAEQKVHEPPSAACGAFDQLQVFAAENHCSERAEIIREPSHVLAVECELALCCGPKELDVMARWADEVASDEVPALAVANQLLTACAAEGPQRGKQVDCFQKVCFALRVVAKQQVKPRAEIYIQPGVIPEITQTQVCQVHDTVLAENSMRGKSGSGIWLVNHAMWFG